MTMSLQSAIVARLSGDSHLYPGLAVGGIYDRPIRSGQGQGATPAAFYVDPADPARLVRLRRTVYVADAGDVPGTTGPTNADERRGWESFPLIYMYVDATPSGKAALDAIDARIKFLLHRWQGTLSGGVVVTMTALNRIPTVEVEEYPGTVVCYRRYQAEFIEL